MAIGDQDDLLARLEAVIPPTWFGDINSDSILTGILNAWAQSGAFNYSQSAYTQLQTRITTATEDNLELIANDFFGPNNFPRNNNENDTSYRNRILASLLRERATRKGIITIVTLLTGNTPKFFEPARPADTGGYNIGGCGYGVAGGWGSLAMPYQAFMVVYINQPATLASVSGWNENFGGWSLPTELVWTGGSNYLLTLTDLQIFAAIASTQTEGTVIWTQIQNI